MAAATIDISSGIGGLPEGARDPSNLVTSDLTRGAQIRAVLGGNVVLISSASARISPEVLNVLNVAFSCNITEGTPDVLLAMD